ncbi:hypothetical protein [Spirosoma litoris]
MRAVCHAEWLIGWEPIPEVRGYCWAVPDATRFPTTISPSLRPSSRNKILAGRRSPIRSLSRRVFHPHNLEPLERDT